MKPKHKVVTRSPHRSVGLVPCSWLQADPIEYESQLEYKFIKKLILTPNVISITSQPFQILYGEDDSCSYTPDFLVNFRNGRALVIEVKPCKFIEKQRNLFDVINEILRQRGFTFCIVTEQEIDVDDSQEEIGLLLRYAKGTINQSSVDAVKRLFFNREDASFTIQEVCRLAQIQKTDVLHLLGRKILFFESEMSTSENTKVTIKNKEKMYDDICLANWLDATPWTTNARIRENGKPNRSATRRCNHTPRLHLDFSEDSE